MNEEKKLIIELAEKALMHSVIDSIHRHPGQMIENLPEEQRKTLQGLTSDHIDGIIPFWLRKKE